MLTSDCACHSPHAPTELGCLESIKTYVNSPVLVDVELTKNR